VNAYARIRREAGFRSQRAVVEALAATGCHISVGTYQRREAGRGADCRGEDLLIAELFSARLGRTVRARHLWGAPQDDDATMPLLATDPSVTGESPRRRWLGRDSGREAQAHEARDADPR
jgi:hypothetical protein